MRPTHTAVLLVASTTAALAQKTVDFQIKYDKPVLQPGEHQQITVSAEFAPGPGQTVIYEPFNKIGTVFAFASTMFDLLNLLNGETGEFTQWEWNPTLALSNMPGVPDGSGNVIGIQPGQSPFPSPDKSDPIWLWTASWQPADYTPRDIVFTTLNSMPAKIYIDLGGAVPLFEVWTPVHLPVAFKIVPSPMSIAPFVLMWMGLYRGRRDPANRMRSRAPGGAAPCALS